LITIVLLGLIGVALAVATVRRGGLAADRQPGRLERTVAGQLVRLSIPSDADRQKSPFANEANTWRDAREHFADHCAVCHGRDGKGNTEMGKHMYPRVPDLTSAEVQGRTDGALFYIIQNGVRWTGMPAWKGEHSPEDTWKLVAFIRRAPTLTEADLRPEDEAATADKPTMPHGKPGHTHRR
jgi:mono/diheme cytochrome c family protein